VRDGGTVLRAEISGVAGTPRTVGIQPETTYLTRAVTFVVPALNEENNISDAVEQIRRAAAGLDDYEVVIVNDASTDRTGAIASDLANGDEHIHVVHNARNLGFGGAYKVGVAHAKMPYVIMVPGDNNHPPDGIMPILDRLGEADIVIPYLTNPEIRGYRRKFISDAYTWLLNLIFRLNVPYYNGLVLHRTDMLKTITIETNGYAYQSEALIKLLRHGASSVSVPVKLSHRDNRTRAFKPRNIARVIKTIWRLALSR
jgi:dolichol-phosphate mannosyltransferase